MARLVWATVFGAALAACTSSNDAPTCSFKDPATLPTPATTPGMTSPAPWSKFRYDVRNTGTIADSEVYDRLAANPHAAHWPKPFESPIDPVGQFFASPVLNATETFLYIGSTNGRLYKLSTTDGTEPPLSDPEHFEFAIPGPGTIRSTALVASRDLHDAIFVGGGDGQLHALTNTGATQASFWPFLYNGSISASPTLGGDGTVLTGSGNGFFEGVCPNGIFRFALSTVGVRSSAAIGADGSVYYGADDGQLRALQGAGVFEWAFATAGAIVTAPVVEVNGNTTTAIYVADLGGRVFKVTIGGRPVSGFNFNLGQAVGPIRSSPALAGNRLYFGSDDGNLYAIDTTTGAAAWAFPTGGAIESSPAVVTVGNSRLIVVGSDDGNVYFVRDDGTDATELTPRFSIAAQHDDDACAPTQQSLTPCAVRSSPAIGIADSTVYVGADDGRVYAIGTPSVGAAATIAQ